MISLLRRQLLTLALIVTLFLFVAFYLTSEQPLTTDGVRSFVGGIIFEKNVDDKTQTLSAGTYIATSSVTLPTPISPAGVAPPFEIHPKILVAATTKNATTSWIKEKLPDWPTAIYTVDDPSAALSTSRNKGNEASAYLTYIIENYEHLPEIVLFIHSHQKHKHGTKRDRIFEGIDYDNFESIQALNLDFVRRNGFTNLRCMRHPGCPAEIQPFRPEAERIPLRPQEIAMPQAWSELFQNDQVPHVLAAPCCAQFAVPGAQIRQRPKADYERFLDWLYNTPLDDFTSGRVFEYLWHVIFGKDPVYCPPPDQCYADQYSVNPKNHVASSSSS